MSAISSFRGAQESARQYFAQLSLFGQTRSVLSDWGALPTAVYFTALALPQSALNTQRRPCSAGTVTLSALFQGIAWK